MAGLAKALRGRLLSLLSTRRGTAWRCVVSFVFFAVPNTALCAGGGGCLMHVLIH